MKEILVYMQIFSFVAEEFIKEVEEFKAFDITARINSPGGNVFDGWGMIAKLKEHEKSGKAVKIKVDGNASSMATIFAAMFDDVEALNITHFMIHKAVMFVETQEEIDTLSTINKHLAAALNKKIDNKKLKKIKGVTIDDIFSDEFDRVDIWLTAQQAKDVGLIAEVTELVEEELQAINKKIVAVSEKFISLPTDNKDDDESEEDSEDPKPEKTVNMTLEELKAKHPELYKSVIAQGVQEEKNRVEAWLVFAEVDPKAVKEGIEKGDSLTPKAMAEFSKKEFSAQALRDNDDDNADDADTDEADDDEEDTPTSKFEAEFDKRRKEAKA